MSSGVEEAEQGLRTTTGAKGVGGLDASRSGCAWLSDRTILRFGHPVHCTVGPSGTIRPAGELASSERRSRRMSRPDGRGGSARAADGSPTSTQPASETTRVAEEVSRAAAHPAQERHEALRQGRSPLSMTSTWTSNRPDHRDHGSVRRRQVDPAQPDRWSRPPDAGRDRGRGRARGPTQRDRGSAVPAHERRASSSSSSTCSTT